MFTQITDLDPLGAEPINTNTVRYPSVRSLLSLADAQTTRQ